jgi:hypothetical protein
MTPRRGKRDEAIQGPRPETQGGSKKTFASRPAMEARPVDQIPSASCFGYCGAWAVSTWKATSRVLTSATARRGLLGRAAMTYRNAIGPCSIRLICLGACFTDHCKACKSHQPSTPIQLGCCASSESRQLAAALARRLGAVSPCKIAGTLGHFRSLAKRH